jgi:hypothetical protein
MKLNMPEEYYTKHLYDAEKQQSPQNYSSLLSPLL